MKKSTVISGVGALAAMAGCTSQQSQKPNIVFFFADDIGVECFGCYGGAEYETPHIDSLASQGIMYTNMNAMPLSSPSRVQVMTGLYNDRNYVCFGYLNDDENTFAHLAQDAGYSTAVVGKWQMGRSREMVPKLGFDESFLAQVELYKESRGEHQTDRYANSWFDDNGQEYKYCPFGPDAMEDYAYDYIDRQVEAGKPFMLYFTEPLVHTPHVSVPGTHDWDWDYDSRFTKGADTTYFPDMVKYLDKQVGNMVRYLKDKGVWDNTIFIFSSDNGTSTRIVTEQKDGSQLRGGKGAPNYRGSHVPLIITWGDRLAGKTSDRLVDLTDILPTIADAVGTPVPAEWDIDGVSLFPEINGEEPLDKELILMHFNPLWPTTAFPKASRYAMDHKYAYFWDGRIYEYKTDNEFSNPIMYADASDEVKKAVEPLKKRVEEVDFYPDMPGQPRRSPYGTFYDFAPPQNPF
jgi:arylsulfatase A